MGPCHVLTCSGGEQIGLSDVNLYRQTGICLNFARDLEQALSAQFGPSSVVELGPTLVRLVGRHEVLLPPNITSTQPFGAHSWRGARALSI
jgi:hypothetical protein